MHVCVYICMCIHSIRTTYVFCYSFSFYRSNTIPPRLAAHVFRGPTLCLSLGIENGKMENIHSTCADSCFDCCAQGGRQTTAQSRQRERDRQQSTLSHQFAIVAANSFDSFVSCAARVGAAGILHWLSCLLSSVFLSVSQPYSAHSAKLLLWHTESTWDFCQDTLLSIAKCVGSSHKNNNYQNDNPETTQSMANGNKCNNSLFLSDMQLWEKPLQAKEIAHNWRKFLISPHSVIHVLYVYEPHTIWAAVILLTYLHTMVYKNEFCSE